MAGETAVKSWAMLYKSYYATQLGESEEQALASTLDLLIDREVLYQYGVENNDLYKPTEYQVNEIVKEMFNSLDSEMESYVKTSKKGIRCTGYYGD